MKKYKAIIFDWDGTAVMNRTTPIDEVKPLLIKLLEQGIILIIISGTTYDKIANGELHKHFPAGLLKNLYLGLGRGAFNYGFDKHGNPTVLSEAIPEISELSKIHEVSFLVHQYLLEQHQMQTDIVFSRPNYCKINLMVDHDRGDRFFLSGNEIEMVNQLLEQHSFKGGLPGLIEKAKEISEEHGIKLKATCDAKYLEIGPTTKADNVSYFLNHVVFPRNIAISDCVFWGDEFANLAFGVKGSDAEMIVEEASGADFFDVSESPADLPEVVKHIGDGPAGFVRFLQSQLISAKK